MGLVNLPRDEQVRGVRQAVVCDDKAQDAASVIVRIVEVGQRDFAVRVARWIPKMVLENLWWWVGRVTGDMEKDGLAAGSDHLGSRGQSVSEAGVKEWLESCCRASAAAAETTPHVLQVGVAISKVASEATDALDQAMDQAPHHCTWRVGWMGWKVQAQIKSFLEDSHADVWTIKADRHVKVIDLAAKVREFPFEDPKVVHVCSWSSKNLPNTKHIIDMPIMEWRQRHKVLWKGELMDGVAEGSVHGSWRSAHCGAS
jgi:hypothetical protein